MGRGGEHNSGRDLGDDTRNEKYHKGLGMCLSGSNQRATDDTRIESLPASRVTYELEGPVLQPCRYLLKQEKRNCQRSGRETSNARLADPDP